MKVGTLCKKNPVTIKPSDELTFAAKLMRERHIGYLIATEPNISNGTVTPVGVLTDRDIVIGVMAKEVDPRALKVGDLMTRLPVTSNEDSSIESALADMRRIGVRRLPVTGRAGELIGVVALDDILDAIAAQLSAVSESIHREQKVEAALRN